MDDTLRMSLEAAQAIEQQIMQGKTSGSVVVEQPAPKPLTNFEKFQKELESLINIWSIDDSCEMPDWILAEYLVNCLYAFNTMREHRRIGGLR